MDKPLEEGVHSFIAYDVAKSGAATFIGVR
jgi:hypothetical protein